MLEAATAKSALFVTLTYAPEMEPENGFLVPCHLKDFLKKLGRKNRIRYYAIGEYGEKTMRPHYHLALFCDLELKWKDGHLFNQEIVDAWSDQDKSRGHVHIGQVTPASAAYMTRYVMKVKWDKYDLDMGGFPPEFQRMSLKPGIGAVAIDGMADALTTRKGAALLAARRDVPTEIVHQGRKYPLGRYLTRKYREQVGMPKGVPSEVSLKRSLRRKEEPQQRRLRAKQHAQIAARRLQVKKIKRSI